MDVILTHEHTDFDALAALLGASKCYPKAVPVLPHQPNRNVAEFLALYGERLPFRSADTLGTARIHEVVLVDTQVFHPLKHTSEDVQVHVIDHHELSHNLPAGWTFESEEVGASTTLLLEKLQQRKIDLDSLEATLMLLGIHEDTGSLTYPHTTARDALAVAWLLEQGADLEQARRFLSHPLSDSQRALYQDLIEHSQVHRIHSHSITVASARPAQYLDEISSVAHLLQDLLDPEALFVLVDLQDHIQLVARSRSDDIDVGAIAEALGGGGHARAAAAVLRDASLNSASERLIAEIERRIRPAVVVRDVMSRQVQVLQAQHTVSEAAQAMLRYGYEGFPVVDGGRLAGMIDRRMVDKAMQHGLGHLLIARLMHYSDHAVHPDDAVGEVQQVMLSEGCGQVPVVSADSGQIVGIVTRSDLIKLWSGQAQKTQLPTRAEMQALMDRALPAETTTLLQQAGQAAQELGFTLYGVGGFVRDLLLQRSNVDLDLVVEGDAMLLAHELARAQGGRVVTHPLFGTAKWIVDEQCTLDFASARTEFYAHPTALPSVEEGSIKLDLHRRDFTINTMAIRLDKDAWGELLDFYGGLRDLRERRIRVLHSLSFIDDPTRILRAVRFEQRFGFVIEPRTEQLAVDALHLVERVSAARIRNEIQLTLREAEPEHYLARLRDLGVLSAICAGLTWEAGWAMSFGRLRELLGTNKTLEHPYTVEPACDTAWLYLALWLCRSGAAVYEAMTQRLGLSQAQARLVAQAGKLCAAQDALADLAKGPASALYVFLHSTSDAARLVAEAASENRLARQGVERYQQALRWIEPVTGGHALREMGIPPGPIYREILDTLRRMRLDDQAHTLADEQRIVTKLLKGERE